MSSRAFLLLLMVFACGDNLAPRPDPVRFSLGDFEVELLPEPARLTIRAGDTLVFDGLPAAKVAGDDQAPAVAAAVRRADATYEELFGSFRIEEQFNPEPWHLVKRFSAIERDGDALRFLLEDRAGGELARATLRAEGNYLTWNIEVSGDQNRITLAQRCQPDEHFLGFGGQSFDVDHRGQTVPIWVQEDGIQKSEQDNYNWGVWFVNGRRHSTHTPMPMYLSSRGYGLVLDSPYRSLFAMCSEADDVVRIELWDGSLAMTFFAGDAPLEIIESMTGWVGRPELPPAFAFAPWLDAIHGEDNVRRIAHKLRDLAVPSSVIWSEDWRGGNEEAFGYTLEEDWTIDRELYPNVEALAAELHELGFKFFNYHNTFLDETSDVFGEAMDKGFVIRNPQGEPYLFDGVKFNSTSLLDLSNPDAWNWAKGVYRDSLRLGFDGYMADFAEWLPVDAVLASGESGLDRHNLYPVDFQRFNRELMAEQFAEDGIERLFFVRSAYLRSQPLVSVVWAGDQQTDFSVGDGLPSIIPMGIGLGVTGFPYYGHDIAGYMSELTEPTSRELFYRWTTLGALSPVMRTHHGRSAAENWSWERDEATESHFARWARFHMQLFPYLYALAETAHQTGAPMFRPLALDYPEFEPGWTATDMFMLGDRIIVAPIVAAGATSRGVALPEGVFYPIFGGDPVSGSFEVEADLEDIPIFVPAGALLVLLPEGIDTAVTTSSAAVTSLDDAGEDREVWLYPGGDSELVEVSGLRYSWRGSSTQTPTSASKDGLDVVLTSREHYLELTTQGPGEIELDNGNVLEIHDGDVERELRVRLYR